MACEKCGGSGFLLYKNENGQDVAKECECRARMVTEARMRKSGIGDAFLSKTIEGFVTKENDTLKNAKRMASSYVEHFIEREREPNNSVMFLGNPGSGKTHLSLAIGNELMRDYGVSCLYMPYRETMTKLKQLATNDKYKYEEEMYKLTTARLLIVDDLYKGTTTEADLNYVFQIINQRYLNQLPFVLSSEKSPLDLLGADEAIGSRLLEQSKGHTIVFNDKKLNHRIYG